MPLPRTRDQALTWVIQLVIEGLGADPAKVTAEARFEQDLGADSLDVAWLQSDIEDQLGVSFTPAETETLTTVGALAAAVANRLSPASAAPR